MRLVDAYTLLVEDGVSDNPRYFAEVYKGFQFNDEDSLADYIDFIVHEPVHWMRGFPAKLTTKTSFSKPKTAVIKLLKKPAVQEDLGADVAETAYGVIWNTFKKEHETLLKEREGTRPFRTVVEHMDRRSDIGAAAPEETRSDVGSYESLEDIEPVPEVRQPSLTVTPWSHAEEIPDAAPPQDNRIVTLKAALLHMTATLPDGVASAFRVLVNAL
jgi:hypothetical protein